MSKIWRSGNTCIGNNRLAHLGFSIECRAIINDQGTDFNWTLLSTLRNSYSLQIS